MKQDATEIVAILDESGSMQSLTMDTIGGFNRFMDEQRALQGEATVTLTLFNDTVRVIRQSEPLASIKPLDNMQYRPSRNTALYDAVGVTISDVGKRLADMAEADRPAKVIVLIMTDGYENHSHEYSHDQVAAMIKHQQEVYGWEFIFMGANIDTEEVAIAMNIPAGNAMSFEASAVGVASNFDAMNSRTTQSRTSNKVGVNRQ